MSEFFQNRLDTAHALIDEHDFDTPVEILQNLKTRIHDSDILTKIGMHETTVEKEYSTRYTLLCQKSGDPYESFKQMQILKKWRATEYLTFYDRLVRENEF